MPIGEQKWDVDIFRDFSIYTGYDRLTLRNGDKIVITCWYRPLRELKNYSGVSGERHFFTPDEVQFLTLCTQDKGKTWKSAEPDPGYLLPDGAYIQVGGELVLSEDKEDVKDLFQPMVTYLKERRMWWGHKNYTYRISVDKGKTWSQPKEFDFYPYSFGIPMGAQCRWNIKSPGGSIVKLKDGRLLLAVDHGIYPKEKRWSVFFMLSLDNGRKWKVESRIPCPHELVGIFEPQVLQTETGRIIYMLRAHKLDIVQGKPTETYTYVYQSESDDYGRTWTEARRTDLWGHPAHLTLLKSGLILCTFGHRRNPFGIRSAYSDDDGESWSPPKIIRDDGCNEDLGYPMSVVLGDGTIFTVYYFNARLNNKPEDYYTYIGGSFYTEEWLIGNELNLKTI